MEDRLRKQIADLKVTMPSTLPIQYVGTDLAGQIIPIVRADCQRKMGEYFEAKIEGEPPDNLGQPFAEITGKEILALKSGTFKAQDLKRGNR